MKITILRTIFLYGCIVMLTAVSAFGSGKEEICINIIGEALFGKYGNKSSSVAPLSQSLSSIPSIILYYTLSMGPTTATFSDCRFTSFLSVKEKERLFFLALNGKALRGEFPRRRGEFSGVAVTSFGCGDSREAFFEEINKNHTEIFREKDYGLSYAVRINRLLDKTGTCGRNGLRRFITALDKELTARYPAFPRLPENTFDPDDLTKTAKAIMSGPYPLGIKKILSRQVMQ